MARLFLIFIAVLLVRSAPGQLNVDELRSDLKRGMATGAHRSLSAQFIVRTPTRKSLPLLNTPPNVIRLNPGMLAVSCDRIKQAVLKELDAKDQWRGKIYVELYPARTLDDNIRVTSIRSPQEWNYRMDLPDTIEKPRLCSAVVAVVLLEMANRQSAGGTAEIPAWLAQGLGQELMQNSSSDLVLETPHKSEFGLDMAHMSWDGQMTNGLNQAHEQLSRQPPLTLVELSWPKEEQLSGDTGEAFRGSAQLFVHELLAMPGGRANLRGFVEALPSHFNWQITFLSAFGSRFGTQLDLEKWWALRVVNFTGRDLLQSWSDEDSWQKLDEVVRPQIQVRMAANEMPLRAEMSLQTIVRDWDFQQQVPVLQQKIQQLVLLRAHISQKMAKLVDDYRQALETYVIDRQKTGAFRAVKGQGASSFSRVLRDAIRQLNELDARRLQALASPNTTNAPPAQTASASR